MDKFRISSLLLGTFLMPVVSYGAVGFGRPDAQFAGVIVSDEALFSAIRNGNFELVNYLLDHGANVNGRMEEAESTWLGTYIHYLSPLVVAIRTGNINMVRLLLKRGANVNPGRGTTNVPLYEAVKKARADMIRLLLEQDGIDVNAHQNVKMSWDECEMRREDPDPQVPQTALERINEFGIGNGPKASEWHEIVRLLCEKGARSR